MLASEIDRREYRVIELENGLHALLVRGSEPHAPVKSNRSSVIDSERNTEENTPTEFAKPSYESLHDGECWRCNVNLSKVYQFQ